MRMMKLKSGYAFLMKKESSVILATCESTLGMDLFLLVPSPILLRQKELTQFKELI